MPGVDILLASTLIHRESLANSGLDELSQLVRFLGIRLKNMNSLFDLLTVAVNRGYKMRDVTTCKLILNAKRINSLYVVLDPNPISR